MNPCAGCSNHTAQQVWGLWCCVKCFAELANKWPTSGDAEAKHPDALKRYEAYKKFAKDWLEKMKARVA